MWEKIIDCCLLLIKESFRREKWKETILVLFCTSMSQKDNNDCDCCSQCEYKDFVKEDSDLQHLVEFLALLTIAQDPEIVLDTSSFMEEFTDMTSRWRSVMEKDEKPSSDSD